MKRLFLVLILIAVFVVGCNPTVSHEVIENNNNDNTNSVSSTSTETQVIPTATAKQTSTLFAQQSQTPSPTAPIDTLKVYYSEAYQFQLDVENQQPVLGLSSESGPWLTIQTGTLGVWAADPDGGGVVQLVPWDGEMNAKYAVFPSPSGSELAVISADDPGYGSTHLNIYSFPYAELIVDIDLISDQMLGYYEDRSDYSLTYNYEQAYYATYYNGSWSPDGEYFAFVGAMDGDSSDLYVFNRETGLIERLTSESTHSVNISWSPDSRHIVFGEVSSLNAMASGRGYSDFSIWDVDVLTGSVNLLYEGIDYGLELVLGWVSNSTFITDTDELGRGRYDLRLVNLDGQVMAELLCENYVYREFDPFSGLLVIQSDDYYGEAPDCDQFDGNGYYVYQLVGTELEFLYKFPDRSEEYVGEPFFEPEHGLFYIPQGKDGYVTVDRDGVVSSTEFEHPYYSLYASPDGENYYYLSEVSWHGEIISIESMLPEGVNAYEGAWSRNGQSLGIVAGDSDTVYVYVAHAPDFEPILVFTCPAGTEFYGAFVWKPLFWVGE